MKTLLKNKFLLSLFVFNLIIFLYNFIISIISYISCFEGISYAHTLSLLTYLSFILFAFLIVNIFILFFLNRGANETSTYSKPIITAIILFIVVLGIYVIFAIPITIYNQIYYFSHMHTIFVTNLINMILQCTNYINLIIYSSILLKKEFTYKKKESSNSSSPS